ncbi:hypothetical protein A3D03_03610 [Candidatus Gottesmanbacteria bacterium RIFCSPHIGHO2_02_FULL_40_13]|uniref:Uncharacterized protein n=1 Tax=Candidatus Gottesmanbacteria bacterium RIFCSPHIGHO2_02_FULL_40_13 TaxID=1798384 RepID=A0A1F6A5S5_9BACT|nr:MAG: hypothetical protein A3D03_03610 [Candidatus Gottesmanbacteria bacterium RIFCSPHIGHO2_02_FULL_40_13]
MDSFKTILKILSGFKNRIIKVSLKRRLSILAIISVIVWIGGSRFLSQKEKPPQYQTSQAEKGILTIIISASGQVS